MHTCKQCLVAKSLHQLNTGAPAVQWSFWEAVVV